MYQPLGLGDICLPSSLLYTKGNILTAFIDVETYCHASVFALFSKDGESTDFLYV